jgi:hypothetical protein
VADKTMHVIPTMERLSEIIFENLFFGQNKIVPANISNRLPVKKAFPLTK